MLRCYKYYFVQNFPPQNQDLFRYKKLYRFKSPKTNQWYWVWVELYPHNLYGVKFHLKADRHCCNKYVRLTNLFEMRPVINTCIAIMYELSQQDARSSFGFIGVNSVGEKKENSQRYRIYKRMMVTYFSDNLFEHIYDTEKSTYMMIRRSELDTNPEMKTSIFSLFAEHYSEFE